MFGVSKIDAFGSYGDFSAGVGATLIRAKYLLTKIKPGQQGQWENLLASQMAPWREIFKVEELTFDELIQRDLDDSRVAHDLIPYLLGETGQHARFFPPILVVLVPKKDGKTGIAPYYPEPSTTEENIVSYGELFDFEKWVFKGQVTPFGQIRYNPQRSAMVIVDGQHRAMAVLALHRQLNSSWGSDPYAPYYRHIEVSADQVKHIELPVCLIYFPDIHAGNRELVDAGIDLTSVCREIFTVVNKQAKEVSKSRELLLDDEDFAAHMMRRTLSKLKDRRGDIENVAKIYSFAFGDSDSDAGSQVMAGRLEYCSAVAIHKAHAAAAFGLPACFNILQPSDITDGRYVRNAERPTDILIGTAGEEWSSLGRRSAKRRTPAEVALVVEKIGDITDTIMLPLFDSFRPFAVHNQALREKHRDISNNMSDPVQSKCKMLMFEGTSVKRVFEDHVQRLNERVDSLKEVGESTPAYLLDEIKYADSVVRALQSNEDVVRSARAYLLFNIDEQVFKSREKELVEQEAKIVRSKAKSIFDTLSSQAFQLGYLMAVLSTVEKMLDVGASYADRLNATKFVSELYLTGINCYFSVGTTKHRTLNGFVAENRSNIFEASQKGFRGLLASTNIKELNEKQWEYFRYVINEIVHSGKISKDLIPIFVDSKWALQARSYLTILGSLLDDIEKARSKYFEAAARCACGSPDFKHELESIEIKAKLEGKGDLEISKLINEAIESRRNLSFESSKGHILASSGSFENSQQRYKLFKDTLCSTSCWPETSSIGQVSDRSDGLEPEGLLNQDVEVALTSDRIRHDANGVEEP